MSSRVWYLAAGRKKVGPLSTSRVMERIAAGKVPSKAMAWREGMRAWQPVGEIAELAAEGGGVAVAVADPGDAADDDAPAPEAPKPRAPKRRKKKRASRAEVDAADVAAAVGSKVEDAAGSGKPAAPAPATPAPPAPAGPFRPLHRIERRDVWRGFGLGLDLARVEIVLIAFGLAGLLGGVLAVVAGLASLAHWAVGIPFALLAGLVAFAVSNAGVGALSYHSRHQLAGAEPPGVKESLGFGLRRVGALSGAPLLLAVAWLAPVLLLGLLNLLARLPYVGPVGTGLVFGLNILLSALTFFLLLSASASLSFGPVIVAFEETGVVETLKALLRFVRRSLVRVCLWALLPFLAFAPFTFGVLAVGAAVVAVPVSGYFGATVGSPAALFAGAEPGPTAEPWRGEDAWADAGEDAWAADAGDDPWAADAGEAPFAAEPTPFTPAEPVDLPEPVAGTTIGAVLVGLWVALAACAFLAIPVSVHNSLLSLLYLGGREGNDDLVSRDDYLAARARAGEEG